jgi:hypothetical protein
LNELRVHEAAYMRELIQLILDADCLRPHAFECGDEDSSIYDLCKAALKRTAGLFEEQIDPESIVSNERSS